MPAELGTGVQHLEQILRVHTAAANQSRVTGGLGLFQCSLHGEHRSFPQGTGFFVVPIAGHSPRIAAFAEVVRQGMLQRQGKLCGTV